MSINGTAQAAPGDAAVELNELLHHIGPEIRPGVFKLALMPQVGGR
jgi:general secretion pathway protein N